MQDAHTVLIKIKKMPIGAINELTDAIDNLLNNWDIDPKTAALTLTK